MTTDPRIDAYIDKAAPFAQPILRHFRQLVHEALPQAEEAIKWSMPHFMVGGKNVAGMAAFKAHCALMIHGAGRQGADKNGGMGGYGKIASLADLPAKVWLAAELREAAERVATQGSAGRKRDKPAPKPAIAMPEDFARALAGNAAAQANFEGFPPGARREYLEWIVEAKRDETRTKRIAQATQWLAEGKKRHWKYERC